MEPIALESIGPQPALWNRRGVLETIVLLSLFVGPALIVFFFG